MGIIIKFYYTDERKLKLCSIGENGWIKTDMKKSKITKIELLYQNCIGCYRFRVMDLLDYKEELIQLMSIMDNRLSYWNKHYECNNVLAEVELIGIEYYSDQIYSGVNPRQIIIDKINGYFIEETIKGLDNQPIRDRNYCVRIIPFSKFKIKKGDK